MQLTSVLMRTIGVLVLAALAVSLSQRGHAQKTPSFPQMPEFTHTAEDEWINSKPLKREDLRGQVVLIDVWTFACWNCYRSFPWLNSLEQTFADQPFTIIGVHSPEFEREKVRDNIVAKVQEFELHHPVMIDNDFSYWKALGNRYWPSFYLIDKQGKARGVWIGETHKGDKRAKEIERMVKQLLKE